MTKEEFMLLTEEEAVEYIKNTYYTDDINDVCEKFIEDFSEDLNEDELELFEIDEERYTPFELVIEILDENNLKEFLWEDIVEECEEIDTEEDGSDAIE